MADTATDFMIDSLEPRRLFADVSLVPNRTLSVVGTEQSETIDVRVRTKPNATGQAVARAYDVFIDGVLARSVPVTKVRWIEIRSHGGNDRITGPTTTANRFLDPSTGRVSRGFAIASMNVKAGSGRDRIVGGSGNDTLLGESGNDLISDSAGRNVLDGGDGDDVLDSRDRVDGRLLRLGRHSGFSPDTLYGGLGNDRVSIDTNDVGQGDVLDRVQVGTASFLALGVSGSVNTYIPAGTLTLTSVDAFVFASPDDGFVMGRADPLPS